MKLKNIGIGCLVILLFAECEHVMDFNENATTAGIVINALATPDTVFTASISRSYLFTDVPAIDYPDYWDYALHPDSFYYNNAVLSKAEVELTVNKKNKYAMTFDAKHHNYTSNYSPQAGDYIVVNVKDSDMQTVSAETTVPGTQQLEIVNYEKYYDKASVLSNSLSDMAKDTVVRITLRLTDPANENNYYRLKVRSIGEDKNTDGTPSFRFSDIYTSSDIIFMDERLTKSYGGWPAHFSNVFDDHLFNGKKYTFTVETRMRFGNNPHAVIELQSITKDFYYYLRSVMLYRVTDQDSYSEAIQIYSNVNSGWGILGGLNAEKHVVDF
jgi:hypothetical protein